MNDEVKLGEVLANNYMLAKLNVRIWSGRKTDKAASAELLADKGAVSNAAAVVKNLLAGNDAKLKETSAAFTRIRTFFYENTAPWTTASVGAMKGDRLVSTVKSITFLSDFAKMKKDAENILNEFITEYNDAVQKTAVTLGALYNPAEYPSDKEIASLFGAEMTLTPLPETTDFDRLTNIPAELASGLKDLYESNMTAQMDNALRDIQRRLMQELERMDTQLTKVKKGEKTRLFKSMVTNLKHLTEMARSMNFTDSSDITEIADKIEAHLLNYEVKDFKDNASLAGKTAGYARDIKGLVSDDSKWLIDAKVIKDPSISEKSTEVVDSVEEITSDLINDKNDLDDSSVNEQTQDDMDFLASLADPDDEEESEEKSAPPEFDEDSFMFSN